MASSGVIKQNIPEIEEGISSLQEKASEFMGNSSSAGTGIMGASGESTGKSVQAMQDIDTAVHLSFAAWSTLIETLALFVNADLSRILEADGQ